MPVAFTQHLKRVGNNPGCRDIAMIVPKAT